MKCSHCKKRIWFWQRRQFHFAAYVWLHESCWASFVFADMHRQYGPNCHVIIV